MCVPAKIYAVLSLMLIIGILMVSSKPRYMFHFISLLSAGVWTWILAVLCKNGYVKTVWGITIFSAVFTLIIGLILYGVYKTQAKIEAQKATQKKN